ncbi:MAG: hypothetical protein C0625_03185 [Arcobacter sp.]|nr:MAG: hypothetical protein C0625_03185 [Arcobacter sp.]
MKYVILIALLSTLYAKNEKIQIFQPLSSSCPQSWLDDIKKEVDEVNIVSLMSVKNLKREIGVPKEIQSCNTSIIDDYIFEGNVPVKAINDFFKNIPKKAIGLSLPAYENKKVVKKVFVIFEDKSFKEFGKY